VADFASACTVYTCVQKLSCVDLYVRP